MLFVLMVFVFCLTSPGMVWGQESARITFETTAPQKINLTVGKSINIESPAPVKRVFLVTPEVADAMVLTPRHIYITGRSPGVTTLTLWGVNNKVSAVLDIEVSPDVLRLQETFREVFPEEKDVKITATHDSITLTGTVSSVNLPKMLALAEPYFPKKIVNLLKVEPKKPPFVIEFIKGGKVSEIKFEGE